MNDLLRSDALRAREIRKVGSDALEAPNPKSIVFQGQMPENVGCPCGDHFQEVWFDNL